MVRLSDVRPAARALAGDRLQDAQDRNALRSVSDYIAATYLICGNHVAGNPGLMHAGRGCGHG